MEKQSNTLRGICISTYLSVFFLASCQGKAENDSSQVSDDFPKQISIVNHLDNRTPALLLSDAVEEVSFVPLETTDQSLIRNIQEVFVTDKDIIIRDLRNILRFSREGKYLNNIGKRGEGPGEYLWPYKVFVDELKKEIYVYDPMGKGYVRVYNLNGDYWKTQCVLTP